MQFQNKTECSIINNIFSLQLNIFINKYFTLKTIINMEIETLNSLLIFPLKNIFPIMLQSIDIRRLNIIFQFNLIIAYILMAGGAQAKEEKRQTIEKLYQLFGSHKQIILTSFTNVGSSQIQQIRKALRAYGNSQLVISKNTLVKKVIRMRVEGIDNQQFKHLEEQFGGKVPELSALTPLLKDKVALIFSDASVHQLRLKIQANKIPTEARVGVVSPIDFSCPAGPTGLDPSQINFFHALNISTKIVKGQIEITKDFKVCTKGKKVKASEAALLKKLNLKPFEYGMKIANVYDDGSILPDEILNLDPASLLTKFEQGVRNITALSLGAGYPIEATIPIIISNAFRNIAAISLESGYKVKEVEAASSSAVAVSAPAKTETKKEEPKKQEKKEVPPPPKEEEQEMDMGGLFD